LNLATDELEMNTEAQKDAVPASNLERLREHLKKDTLADRLVSAGIATTPAERKAAFEKVIGDRLAELKKKHEPVQDQKA